MSPLRLRTRLIAAVMGPLIIAAGLLGVAGYWLVADVAERTNDRVLIGALGAIAETVSVEEGEVTLDLPPAAFGMLENSERDNVYYRIAQGPRVLTGYDDLPAPDPATLKPDMVGLRYARFRGLPIRIAELTLRLPRIREPVYVQVAETLGNRTQLQRRMLIGMLVLELTLVVAAALLLIPALVWSLRPLAALRRAVERRSGQGAPDLSALDTGPLPAELRPLADAFDRLLARLDMATLGVRRFTADASHQMRTPLSVLKVQVALARQGADSALDEISDATDRLERLLTQLLSLARAQEEGQSAQPEAVDLREVCTRVLTRRIGQAMEADVDVRLDADDDERFIVPGHRTLIFELISNLVDNAIRYNRRGGEVAVAIRRDAGAVIVTVEDDGPGIPEAEQARVFDRFVRLDPGDDRGGSGLGLAIAQSIAARLGAQIGLATSATGGVIARISFLRLDPTPASPG